MSRKRKIRVAVVDDHVLFATGMANLLDSVEDMSVVATAGDGKELLEKLKILKRTDELPDVILMDIQMPVMDGFQACVEVKDRFSSCKVVILSMHQESSYIYQAVISGADGFLLKNAQPEEVINAIRSVEGDGQAFNKEAVLVMKNVIADPVKAVLTRKDFSENELKILNYVCREKTNKEIADKMNLSVSSVENYKQKMIKRMGVKTSVGLAIYAIQNKIVDM